MSTERNIQQDIRLALSRAGSRMFRNNVGQAWTGRVVRNTNGSITIYDPRPLDAGLCKGSSDLIGWTPVTVTADMVGKKLAVFTAIEVKGPKGKTSPNKRILLTA